jgi:SAM-dependent methyltransferase
VNPERERWNAKHRKGGHELPSIPLLMHQGRLARGRLLDLAGGLGENAAVLALAGWTVVSADLSDVAVARAAARARDLKAGVRVVQADALRLPFRGPFETVVVARFLERRIAPELVRLLAPGGTLFCDQRTTGSFAARPGEFPRLFPTLEVLLHREEDGRAVFIGRKPVR